MLPPYQWLSCCQQCLEPPTATAQLSICLLCIIGPYLHCALAQLCVMLQVKEEDDSEDGSFGKGEDGEGGSRKRKECGFFDGVRAATAWTPFTCCCAWAPLTPICQSSENVLLTASTPPPFLPRTQDRQDDGNASKRPRVVWSVEMHQQFVSAVNQLGIESECCYCSHTVGVLANDLAKIIRGI